MAGEDILMMSEKETRRPYMIRAVIEGKVKQVEAAGMLLLLRSGGMRKETTTHKRGH